MSLALADEPTVIGRILDHIDRGTTDVCEGVWREPVEHYLSQERFEAEIGRVLRRTATPFCPSLALPEAGSYVAREAALTPIVAVRGADGKVRAFRNACRHRGAQVVDGMGCRKVLSCRYHGWTYGLDGALRGIPHEHGFPGLDKADYGLVPVRAEEKHGLVFVTQDGDEAAEDLVPDFFGPGWRLIGAGAQDIPANWKIVTEGVLEGYHIRTTHTDSFFPRQYDNLTLVETFGRILRVSFRFGYIERLRDAQAEARRTMGVLTHVYHLFPNAAVVTFPTHSQLVVFEPVAIDRTRTVTYTLTNRDPEPEAETAVAKGKDFVASGVEEDRAVQIAIQRGLAAGANEVFTFGRFEGAIQHLHRNLADALARP